MDKSVIWTIIVVINKTKYPVKCCMSLFKQADSIGCYDSDKQKILQKIVWNDYNKLSVLILMIMMYKTASPVK